MMLATIKPEYHTNDHVTGFPEDEQRLVNVMAHAGYRVSVQDAVDAWSAYSDTLFAGWLSLPIADSEIVEGLLPHLTISVVDS